MTERTPNSKNVPQKLFDRTFPPHQLNAPSTFTKQVALEVFENPNISILRELLRAFLNRGRSDLDKTQVNSLLKEMMKNVRGASPNL